MNPNHKKSFDDYLHPFERHLPRLQRYGVILCTFIIGLGMLGGLLSHSNSLTMAGIVLLILLPVFRVVVLLVVFLLKRDFLYVALTMTVFAIIVVGVVAAGLSKI